MQQRDQPRAAFVDEAEFLGDPGADLARRARQGRPDPGLQGVALLGAHLARTAAHLEAVRPSTPSCSNSSYQSRIVSSSNNRTLATSWQLKPSSNRTSAVARRVTRPAAKPSRANAISALRSSSQRKPPRIMRPSESSLAPNASFFPTLQ